MSDKATENDVLIVKSIADHYKDLGAKMDGKNAEGVVRKLIDDIAEQGLSEHGIDQLLKQLGESVTERLRLETAALYRKNTGKMSDAQREAARRICNGT